MPFNDPKKLNLYSKDNNNVYYRDKKIEANPNSFSLTGNCYGRDANNIYYKGKKVLQADPATFKENYIETYNAIFKHSQISCEGEDKDNKFIGGSIVE